MVDVAAAAAVIVIAFARQRGPDIRVRSRCHPVVPGVGRATGDRPEAVHAEQAQQKSAHEQHAGPQRQLRSGELSGACHGPIVGTDHLPLASRTSPE